jgi:hypothetical protein
MTIETGNTWYNSTRRSMIYLKYRFGKGGFAYVVYCEQEKIREEWYRVFRQSMSMMPSDMWY